MKMIAICCGLCLIATSASAALKNYEVKRLGDAATVVTDMRTAPDRGIPDDLWARAECVLVIPSMKKAAFLIGGESGYGVMSCRRSAALTTSARVSLVWGTPQ